MLHDIRWTLQKIAKYLELIQPQVYRSRISLPPFKYRENNEGLERLNIDPESAENNWKIIPANANWGKPNINFLLRTSFEIPAVWHDEDTIALYLPIGEAGDFSHPEALVYIDSKPITGIDKHHLELILPGDIQPGILHNLLLRGWTGSLSQGEHVSLTMGECVLVVIDQPTRDFIALARVALGVANHLDENNLIRIKLINSLNQAMIHLDVREPFDEGFYEKVHYAHKKLLDGIRLSGSPLDVEITAVGHAHLDLGWLWTLTESRIKAGRTFYSIIRLMEKHPDFGFVQSQPQLYEYVQQDFPNLFDEIKQKVKEGSWEIIGGMWVEADCNISGGESLARQLVLGRSYFRQYFGEQAESPVLWLPDVFGFSWNLPQLIKEAGLDYFFTIKLGWSQYNRIPYDSFWWQGLDGTRILTHFSTTKESNDVFTSTFNATASPEAVINTWENFQQKDWGTDGSIPPLLMVYGFGDGGGGPTREMIENIDIMEAFPATPRVKMGKVKAFFKELESRSGDYLPVWNDELYLEYHRGIYTSQARLKRANRKSEFLLHDVEFLASLATIYDKEFIYPKVELNKMWQLVCLNQFHDILAGTSIREVHEEALEQYTEVLRLGKDIRQSAIEAIAKIYGGDLLVINPTSFSRTDYAFFKGELPAGYSVFKPDGSQVQVQEIDGGYLLDVGEIVPYSFLSLAMSGSDKSEQANSEKGAELTATEQSIENHYLRIAINNEGEISSIFNKLLSQEMIPDGGTANQFQAFQDRPRVPDAWDFDVFFDDKMMLAEPAHSISLVEVGKLRATIEIRRKILNSKIIQHISLAYNSSRIDFKTHIDWNDRNTLLKVAFPVNVLSPMATYEIPWGDIQRPTHRNTSWDWAKFEVPAQKWVDLSEGGYGVSLLNDCKYGCDIHENVIRLTLLRSPVYPDPSADQGGHDFVYSLLPHGQDWKHGTISESYSINDPLITYINPQSDRGHDRNRSSFIRVDKQNVIIETIKISEDGQGLIVRVYESQRMRSQCILSTNIGISGAYRTNLMEDNSHPLEVSGNQVRFEIKPYQIVTLRLILDSPNIKNVQFYQ